MYAGLQRRPVVRQARDRRDDLAGLAFGSAADRAASIAIDGFGVKRASGAGRSRCSIPAVFSGHSRRAGLAGFAWRAGRSRRTGIALVPLGTLEASPERDRGHAQDDQRWKKPAAVADMFHLIVVRPKEEIGKKSASGITEIDIRSGALNRAQRRLFPSGAFAGRQKIIGRSFRRRGRSSGSRTGSKRRARLTSHRCRRHRRP